MHIFPGGFGLAMTFVHEKEKPSHPNTRTQPGRVFCQSRSRRAQESGNTWCFSIRISTLWAFSSLPKLNYSHARAQQLRLLPFPGSVILRETRLLLGLREPLSQGPQPFCVSRAKSRGSRMGGHATEAFRTMGPLWPTCACSQGQPGRPRQREVELISHFMHTHMPASHI